MLITQILNYGLQSPRTPTHCIMKERRVGLYTALMTCMPVHSRLRVPSFTPCECHTTSPALRPSQHCYQHLFSKHTAWSNFQKHHDESGWGFRPFTPCECHTTPLALRPSHHYHQQLLLNHTIRGNFQRHHRHASTDRAWYVRPSVPFRALHGAIFGGCSSNYYFK
jgi:hypothetical protein